MPPHRWTDDEIPPVSLRHPTTRAPGPRVRSTQANVSAGGRIRFREMYEAEAGRNQIDGRAPLDIDGMTRRMEDVLERTLRRS